MVRRLLTGLALVPILMLAMAPTASAGVPVPTTRVVDDDGMAQPGNCSSSSATFPTIPAAVAAAAPLDTILVCPGTYDDGQIIVDKPLTILGANAGEAIVGCDTRGGESRVQNSAGAGGTGAFFVQANGVVIDGFTIQNNAGPGIQTSAVFSGYQFASTSSGRTRSAST